MTTTLVCHNPGPIFVFLCLVGCGSPAPATALDAGGTDGGGQPGADGSDWTPVPVDPVQISDACLDADPEYASCGQQDPKGMAVDDTDVYWVAYKTNRVHRTSKHGGAPVLIGEPLRPNDVALAGQNVFLAKGWGATISSVSKTGGDVIDLMAEASGGAQLLVEGDYIYAAANIPMGHVFRVSLAEGEPQIIATASAEYALGGFAVDEEQLYWSDTNSGTVYRTDLSTLEDSPIARDDRMPTCVVYDDDYVYWASFGEDDGAIVRAPKSGGDVEVLAEERAHGLMMDGDGLIWINLSTSEMKRKGTSGAPERTLAVVHAEFGCHVLGADQQAIYWIDPVQGGVFRLAKWWQP